MSKLKRATTLNQSQNIGWLHNQRRHLITAVGLLSITIIFLSVFSSFALSRFEKAAEEEEQEAKSFWSIVDHTRNAEIHFRIQVQEWKNVLLRGYDLKDFSKYHEAFKKQAQRVSQDLKIIEASAPTIGLDAKMVKQVQAAHDDLTLQYLIALQQFQLSNVSSYQEVDRLVRGKDRPFNQSFSELN